MKITLIGLPKTSLNKFYAGMHWTKRKHIKDNYTLLVKSQFKHVFSKDSQYEVDYMFCFKNKPLDASNTIGMVKLIEDIIFEDDKYNIILKISISSGKSQSEDYVVITVNEIT